MLQKYGGGDLLHLCATNEPNNEDNARTFGIWFDDKLREVYATNECSNTVKVRWKALQ